MHMHCAECVRYRYEELTAWKQKREQAFTGKVRQSVPALPGGSGQAGGAGGGGYGGAGGAAGGGYGGAGGGGRQASPLLKQLLAQGYTMQEVTELARTRPELVSQLFV